MLVRESELCCRMASHMPRSEFAKIPRNLRVFGGLEGFRERGSDPKKWVLIQKRHI